MAKSMVKRGILVLLIMALLMNFVPGMVYAQEEALLPETQTEAVAEVITDEPAETEATESTEEDADVVRNTKSASSSVYAAVVSQPTVGTAYKLAQYDSSGVLRYFTGFMEGYYLQTSTDPAVAVDVMLEYADGGFRLFYIQNDVKVYVRLYQYTDGRGQLELTAIMPQEVYEFDETAKTLVYRYDESNAYYMGTFSTYTTISVSHTRYITGDNAENLDVSQFPARLYTIESSTVANVEFSPITVYENVVGDWNGVNFRYWWWEQMAYTITYTDGSTYEGMGTYFEHRGKECELVFSDTQAATAWKVGNTYNAKASFLGYEVTVPVTVAQCPVERVEINPSAVTIFENNNGQHVEDYFENWWWDSLTYTVFFKDGSSHTGNSYFLEYEGYPYAICKYDGQYENHWQAGNTYEVIASFIGYEVTIPVTVVESPVESVEVAPVTIFENNRGQWMDGSFEYWWWDSLTYTVTFKNGKIYTGQGWWFEYEDQRDDVPRPDGQQETPWEAGNTYECKLNFLGYDATVPVTVETTPVVSVETEPVTLWERTEGEWHEDSFYYWWWNKLSYTITYTDGSTYAGDGYLFEYQGNEYEVFDCGTQNSEPMEAGNTYDGTINFLGYDVTVPVTILECPIADVEFEPITILENGLGDWNGDDFYYWWWENLSYTITYTDGSAYESWGTYFEYQGEGHELIFLDTQEEVPWKAGNTYEATANFLGYEITVPVTVAESPVASVAVEPISLFENTYYYGESTCCWWDALNYTITFKDGSTYTGSGYWLEYEGQSYPVPKYDSQDENPWEAGNTYEVIANFLGYDVTVPVTVLECPVSDVAVEPVSLFENTYHYGDSFYHWWDILSYTVTYKDGTTDTAIGEEFEYQGNPYYIQWSDSQEEASWEAGNDYEITVNFLGYEVTVPVTIEPSPIVSVDVQPITIFENSCYDFNGSYYQYYWWYEFGYTVHYAKGNPYTGRGGYFKYWGNEYAITFEDFQEETPWEVGNTYEVTVWFLDYEVTVPVTIAPCPVVDAQVEPITMVAYTGGDWYEDAYQYYWWNDVTYTVTFADGTTYSNSNDGVEYDGWIYNYFYWDPQYDGVWEAGNTYECRLNFLGYETTVPVTIVESAYIASSSLSLGSTLQLNISAELNGLDPEGHALQVKIGEDVMQLTDFQVEGESIVFTVPLPAHLLHQDIRLELMYDDEVVDVKTWTLGYYYYTLRWEYADDTALMTLLDALSDYAAYAQYFADPDSGNNPDIAAVETVIREDLNSYKPVILTADRDGLGAATSLYLDDACDLQIKFNAANWAGHTLYINGQAVTPAQVGSKMVYEIRELLPQEWSDVYNIQVVDAAGSTVFEVDYSVLSYGYICLGRQQESQTGLNGLMKAMYLYSKAASDYQG